MSIFNNEKQKNNPGQDISLADYEKRVEERREEYRHLNEILRGMRAEVSNLMEDIKKLTDELVKKNAEKFLTEQKIDDLNRSYELLVQNVKYEEETYVKVNNELARIKKELLESQASLYGLKEFRSEYEKFSETMSSEKLEPEIISDKSISIIDEEINQIIKNQQSQISGTRLQCAAFNKNGTQCKRPAAEGSIYCPHHSPEKKSKKGR